MKLSEIEHKLSGMNNNEKVDAIKSMIEPSYDSECLILKRETKDGHIRILLGVDDENIIYHEVVCPYNDAWKCHIFSDREMTCKYYKGD